MEKLKTTTISWTNGIVKIILVAGALLFGIFLILIVVVLTVNDRSFALASGLPQNIEASNKVFDFRIKKRFPAGISVRTLKNELEKQGFSVAGHRAEFKDQRFVILCPTTYIIRWEIGQQGDIAKVAGNIHHVCF